MTRPANRWTRVAFGDVVRKVSDRVDPETSGLERYVAGEHMDTDDLRIRRWGMIGDGYLGPAFHMRFKPGQVLYGSRRTYLRKVAVPDFEGVTANTTFVLEPKDPAVLLPEFLPYVMSTESFHSYSIAQSKGSVNPYINFSDLAKYEFALPPLQEQRRIATLLRASEDVAVSLYQLGSRLEAAQASLEMETAVNFAKELGARGETHRLGDVADIVPGYPFNSEDFRPASSDGVPLIRIRDLRTHDPEVRIAHTVSYPRTVEIEPGEMIIGMDGEFDVVEWAGDKGVLNQRLCCVRPSKRAIDSGFLLTCLRPVLRRLCLMTGATTVRHISAERIADIGIVLPSRSVQAEIGHVARSLRSQVVGAATRLEDSKSIRQAVLAGIAL